MREPTIRLTVGELTDLLRGREVRLYKRRRPIRITQPGEIYPTMADRLVQLLKAIGDFELCLRLRLLEFQKDKR